MSKTGYKPKSKKVVQQTLIADYESGEVKNETNVLILPQEPPFIKLYIDDILYLNDMPRHLNPILQAFLKNMTWENRLILNMAIKKEIAKSINLSVSSIDNALSKLVKGNILIRKDKGLYLFNPYLFGKGNWESIQEIRLNITYDLKGRTFSSKIKTIEDIENGQTDDTTGTTN